MQCIPVDAHKRHLWQHHLIFTSRENITKESGFEHDYGLKLNNQVMDSDDGNHNQTKLKRQARTPRTAEHRPS